MASTISGCFITGTDTDCGKTVVSCALMRQLRAQGKRVAPFKPVAAGAVQQNGAWRNEDAQQLIAAAGKDWRYDQVNPYCFPEPISPHLAAEQVGAAIQLGPIVQAAQRLATQADLLIVEGAGGWLAPLNATQTIADIAVALDLPVLLVVGLRLGCLNHAQLSAQAIQSAAVPVLGWIGAQLDPVMPYLAENVQTLQQRLPLPYYGYIPYGETEQVGYLDKLVEALCEVSDCE